MSDLLCNVPDCPVRRHPFSNKEDLEKHKRWHNYPRSDLSTKTKMGVQDVDARFFTFTLMQQSALNLIDGFLCKCPALNNVGANASCPDAQHDRRLDIRFPRQYGSTTVAQEVVNRYKCLAICANTNSEKKFREIFVKRYDNSLRQALNSEYRIPSVISIFDMTQRNLLLDTSLDSIVESIRNSRIILFDGFRSYSENRLVKSLFKEFSTHRFICLW